MTNWQALTMVTVVILQCLAMSSNIRIAAAGIEESTLRFQQTTKRPPAQKNRPDYSKFSHQTHVTKQQLKCDSCHKFPTSNWQQVRKGEAAFPDVADFPEHSTCLNCHRQQFFARERPAPAICSNCHVRVSPRNTSRFLFPSLGDVSDSSAVSRNIGTEFVVSFPHDKHLDAVGSYILRRSSFVSISWQQKVPEPAEPKNCAVCHRTYQPQGTSDEEYVTKPPKELGDNFWLKKGTFKTLPRSHAVCFTCHNTEVGIPPSGSDCAGCHKFANAQDTTRRDFDPKLPETIGVTDAVVLATWRQRISSGTFRHEGGDHPSINCMSCHNVPTMNTTDVKTLKVPVRTCGGVEGCHITATTDDGGILNYEIDKRKQNAGFACTKCHLAFSKQGIPDTHVQVIQALKKS